MLVVTNSLSSIHFDTFLRKIVPFFINDLGMGGSMLVQLTGNARLGDVMNAKKIKLDVC